MGGKENIQSLKNQNSKNKYNILIIRKNISKGKHEEKDSLKEYVPFNCEDEKANNSG